MEGRGGEGKRRRMREEEEEGREEGGEEGEGRRGGEHAQINVKLGGWVGP